MRAAVLYNKVSNFSDGLVKYNCPYRRREGTRGGEQVKRHLGTGWCGWLGSHHYDFSPGEIPSMPIE